MSTNNQPVSDDVVNYRGKAFVTEHKSHYAINANGEFKGRPSIDGAKVKLLAGVEEDPFLLKCFINCLDTSRPELRDRLDELIRMHGQELKPGLYLVASLTPEAAKEKGRHGIITSRITSVDYIN
jgi:hypothetical protein